MKHTNLSCKIITLVVCAAMLLGLNACGSSEAKYQTEAMGTVVTATAYGKNGDAAVKAACSVFSAMGTMLDPESETSVVYDLNNASGASVVVPGQIIDMLNTAKTVYEKTDGALDFTVYPLLRLWGFNDGNYRKPSDDDIALAREKLCFEDIKTESFTATGTNTVALPDGAGISFNAAARGCAADNAVKAMVNAGAESGIISMPGCVKTLGVKPDGSDWTVAVQNPDDSSSAIGYLTVGQTAVSTSGGYTQSFTYADGSVYGHIIDPSTGYPVEGDLKSVTVICEDATLADCLSTALFVLGRSAALNYWRAEGGFQLIMVTTSGQVLCTSGLTESFKLNSADYALSYTE